MLARLRAALAADGAPEAPAGDGDAARVACAALLVEAAGMDERFDESERETILALLARRFGIGRGEAARLLAEGEREAGDSVSLYRFTRRLNDAWSGGERAELLHLLWCVAYADGVIDPHEDMLIRRLAGLLHVSDHARAEARRRAAQTSRASKESP